MPVDQRAFFEPRLGADLGGVRLHTGAGGAKAASAQNAQAYTVGHDIVFGSGQYAPETAGGKRLLAHELVHTLQQSPSRQDSPARIPGGPAERATDSAAQAVLSGGSLPSLAPTGIGVARQATANDPAKLNDEDLVNETVYLVNDIKAGRLKPGTEQAYRSYLQLLVNQFTIRGVSNPSLLSKNQYLLEAAFSSLSELAQLKSKPKAATAQPATAHEPDAGDQFDRLTAISEEFARSFAGNESAKRVKRLAELFGTLEPEYARRVDEVITKGALSKQFQKIPARARKQLTDILTQRQGKVSTLRPGILGKGSKRTKEWDYYIVRNLVSIDDIARYLSTDPNLPAVLEAYNHIPHDKTLSAGTQVYFQMGFANRPEAQKQIREDLYYGRYIPTAWGAIKISHSGERSLLKDNIPLTKSEFQELEENERGQAATLKTLKKMDEDQKKQLKEDTKRAKQVPNALLTFFFPTSALYVKDQSSLIHNPLLRFQYQTNQSAFYAGTNLGRASGAVGVGANLLPLLVLDAAALPEFVSVLGTTEAGTSLAATGRGLFYSARGLYLWAGQNPRTAIALISGGYKLIANISSAGGPRNYLHQVTTDFPTFLSQVIDLAEVYEGSVYDQPGSAPRTGGGGSPAPADEPSAPAPTVTTQPKAVGGSPAPLDEPPAPAPTVTAQPKAAGGSPAPVDEPPAQTGATQQKAGGGGPPPPVNKPPVKAPAAPVRPSSGVFGKFFDFKALRLSGAILKGAGDINPPDIGVSSGKGSAPRPAIVQPAAPDLKAATPQPTTPTPQVKVAPTTVVEPDQAPAPAAQVQPAPAPVAQVQPSPVPTQAPAAPAQPAPAPVAQVEPAPAPAPAPTAPVQPAPAPAPQVQPAPIPAPTPPAAVQPAPAPAPAAQAQPAPIPATAPPAPVKPAARRRYVVTPASVKAAPTPTHPTAPVVVDKPTVVQPAAVQPKPQEASQAPLPVQVSKEISVGEVLTVPYGKGLVRAKVVARENGYVTIRFETKHRIEGIERPGAISERLPLVYLEQKIKTGQVIRWLAERDRLMNRRPVYEDGLVASVWANARQPDGKVYDPHSKVELTWDTSKNRYNQWHMGHRPGFEYVKLVDRYINGEITLDDFLKEYNNPDNYWPEDPSENLSHEHEE